jgi:hypothetical protein
MEFGLQATQTKENAIALSQPLLSEDGKLSLLARAKGFNQLLKRAVEYLQ